MSQVSRATRASPVEPAQVGSPQGVEEGKGGDPACLRNSPVLWTPNSPGQRTNYSFRTRPQTTEVFRRRGKNLPSSPKISGEQRGDFSIIGNVLILCKEKAFGINDAIKTEFQKVSKRNQMTAETLWKGAGLGGQGEPMLRPFAFSLASPCFQKQESFFVKTFLATRWPRRMRGGRSRGVWVPRSEGQRLGKTLR